LRVIVHVIDVVTAQTITRLDFNAGFLQRIHRSNVLGTSAIQATG
jgi:hypothetical protein